MARFKNRKLMDMDMDDRFEGNSTSVHNRNARGSIERLKEYGQDFWDEGTKQLGRWEEGCNTLWQFINNLGKRRHIDHQNLECVLRVFIAEFEHTKHRFLQMVWGELENKDDSPIFKEIYDWIVRVERYCIYAIVSFWIDDKYDKTQTKIDMKFKIKTDNDGVVEDVACETNEKTHHNPMQVPRKHRRASTKLE